MVSSACKLFISFLFLFLLLFIYYQFFILFLLRFFLATSCSFNPISSFA